MTSPAVTVVIICYNDETRLPKAIRSAQRQTLAEIEIKVVDHGSTDGSAQVARDAAAEDPRIEVIALGENEGKPGRPINAGIAAATAPWVVVVGSDDILRRRGCETLLAAAERSDADVVIGGVRRVDMDTREAVRWMPSVTLRSRVVKDLAQFPDLIRDTIGGFKLYRTQFLRDNGPELRRGHLLSGSGVHDRVLRVGCDRSRSCPSSSATGATGTPRTASRSPSARPLWRTWPIGSRPTGASIGSSSNTGARTCC